MQRGPISAEEIVKITNEFPSQIKSIAKLLPLRNKGPFPLCHNNFLHSNIIVNKATFNGLVTYPKFIQVMPQSFNLPQHYNQDRHPLKKSVREKRRKQQDYIKIVKTAEGKDNLLSTSLSSNLNQASAYSYKAFTTKELGFYNKVVTKLKKKRHLVIVT
ncbi:hypothetical protein CT0861_02045 [Colletotrichum tofieldiae]|uniref:Uncharacterized protein n=1 Tax=Colletotrichum tofieldiae TaxID=708197 RepID=A0A166LW33_9PEZI|nr:hypothetical protein CT0861_02045 [Colletotrichum tofieldiae]